MQDALIDIVAIAVRHLDEVPNNARRAAILNVAASLCGQTEHLRVMRDALERAASDLRKAEDAQLYLTELFSTH